MRSLDLSNETNWIGVLQDVDWGQWTPWKRGTWSWRVRCFFLIPQTRNMALSYFNGYSWGILGFVGNNGNTEPTIWEVGSVQRWVVFSNVWHLCGESDENHQHIHMGLPVHTLLKYSRYFFLKHKFHLWHCFCNYLDQFQWTWFVFVKSHLTSNMAMDLLPM